MRYERLLRGTGSVLFWAAAIVLGAFGAAFSVANYSAFGIVFVVLILLLTGYMERARRLKWKAAERAERRERARRGERPLR